MEAHSAEPIVSFSGVSMAFPEVLANDDVSLDIYPGEIFALVGENGAGKSTLMNILYGMLTPTAGTVGIKGQTVARFSPREAIAMGVGMVHQHFMLVPSFTVAQNIVLSREPRRGKLFYDFKKAKGIVEGLVAEYGLAVNPEDRVSEIGVGIQQRVEILKTLYRGADILILDEPTAVLTPGETEELFTVIRRIVKEKNITVILITHKLYEVISISHRVGVMRQGRLVGIKETAATSEGELASLMVGREMLFAPLHREDVKVESPALSVENLQVLDNRGLPAVKNVSFSVKSGEILGIAGVEGNGQSELIEAITGLRPARGGQVTILGKKALGLSCGQIRKLGLSHVPEDRLSTGAAKDATVAENLIAGKQRLPQFSLKGIHLRRGAIRRYGKKLYDDFDIRGAGIESPMGALSGGNMQKAVVAREFSMDTPVLVIAQPTRGVDIGAMEFIHGLIVKKRNEGCAVLLVSADLDEVMRLSDRILTLYEGTVTGEFPGAGAPETTKEALGICMAGGRKEAGADG